MNGEQVILVPAPQEEKGISATDILVLSTPVIVGAFLFKDQLLRLLGIKQVLIVYFSTDDYESAKLLKRAFGFRADVIYLPPSAVALPPEADEYKYVILIGGQNINPFYADYVRKGMLRPITTPGEYVIQTVGNLIFIAGYESQDTYKACEEFIRTYLQK